MAQAAAVLVARHLPQAEIIDYASDIKADVPSGTSRELAERLAVSGRRVTRSLDEIDGPPEARGASSPVPSTRSDCRASRSRPKSSSRSPTNA